MLPYAINGIIAVCIGAFASRQDGEWEKASLCCLAILPCCILAGFRDGSIGVDTLGYPYTAFTSSQQLALMDEMAEYSLLFGGARWEPLYTFSCWIVTQLFGSFNSVLLFLQMMTALPTVFAIKKLAPNNIGVGLLVYCLIFFPVSLNLVRQCIASGWVLLLFAAFWNGEHGRSVVYLVVAMGFHLAGGVLGVIVVFVAALVKRKGNGIEGLPAQSNAFFVLPIISGVVLLCAFSLLAGTSIIEIIVQIKPTYTFFQNSTMASDLNNSAIALLVFTLLFHAAITKCLTNKGAPSSVTDLRRALLVVVVLGCICAQLGLVSGGLGRIGTVFIIFTAPYFALTTQKTERKGASFQLLIAPICFCIAYFCACYYPTELVPYTSEILGITG